MQTLSFRNAPVRTSNSLRHLAAAISMLVLLLASPTIFGAQNISILHEFAGGTNDGASPLWMHLIQATDGNFYGTTEYGGISNCGTVFKMTSTGALTVLYNFRSYLVNDGAFPEAGLAQGPDGNFYGTTYEGGTNAYGTIFKMTPAGVLTNFHIFETSVPGDGRWPFAPLISATDGYLYGTASAGGTRGYGCVYRIDTNGNYSTVYSFTNGVDGSDPYAGVYQGSDGFLYGTCSMGGSNNSGTVYKVSTGGAFTSLHEFSYALTEGQSPIGGIVQGYTGDYFGTTYSGGTNGYGTVFRITSTGAITYLYNFGGPANDGLNPRAALLQASDGYLYGTTFLGGINGNAGTLFKIGTYGGLTYVHNFAAFAGDGSYPENALVQDYYGNIYGTTYQGGTNSGLGVVFMLTNPVPSNPNSPGVSSFGSANSSQSPQSNTVVLNYAGIAGETVQWQYLDQLPPIWNVVPGSVVTNSIGGPTTFTNLTSSNVMHRFYRLKITP